MKNRLLNILESGNDARIKEADLAAYLKEQLTDAEKHALEESISSQMEGLETDAMEGWLATTNKEKLVEDAAEINKKLAQQLKLPKKRVRKRPIKQLAWQWLLLGFILLLTFLGWLIIYWLQN
jgi:hypothetical protein